MFSERRIGLVCIGRLEEQKDPLRFLDIVHQLGRTLGDPVSATWIAPGDGSLKRQFLDRRKALGLSGTVELIVGGSHSATREIVARSKVFMLTSRWEGLPLSALEALASGTPVVTTPCGEIGDIVSRSSCGATFTDDTDADMSLLANLLNSRSAWTTASSNALVTASAYSEDAMFDAIAQLYATVATVRSKCA
ncbi:glycosyltransferase family 4 protein [Mycolicibacterium baixiangningiae]|uniref:glycosyltransferase family 4 protein n=1 Tax=Mycolicibacterium baixiangningiae TaxID=2761578 RepID=UPI001D021FC6|nr:glycosyltransferase family 4 protein [Mycolicibacterium baixiangningiae]